MGKGRGRVVRDTNSATLPAARPEVKDSKQKGGDIQVIRGNTDVLTVQFLSIISNNIVTIRDDLRKLVTIYENRRDG